MVTPALPGTGQGAGVCGTPHMWQSRVRGGWDRGGSALVIMVFSSPLATPCMCHVTHSELRLLFQTGLHA